MLGYGSERSHDLGDCLSVEVLKYDGIMETSHASDRRENVMPTETVAR